MFLLGNWKSFDDLEEYLSLPELEMILKAKREREKQERYFLASIQGIDLSKNEESDVQRKLEEARRRAAIKLHGVEAVERQEFAELGFDFEVQSE